MGNCRAVTSTSSEVRPHAAPADKVGAPLIGECYANFECRLSEGRLFRSGA